MQPTPPVGASAAARPSTRMGIALVLLAFAAGVAVDRVGASHRFDLLALPMLGLLAWNLAVYLLLAVPGWRRAVRTASTDALASIRAALPHGWRERADEVPAFSDRADADATGWRLSATLHAAAAALALGAIASMYLRGLGVAYRAGWESTFLDAPSAHCLVTVLLGPAAWLLGTPLPDATAFAALRGPAGAGENAARWIHIHALTLFGVIVLPRALLAAWSVLQARRAGQRHAPAGGRVEPSPLFPVRVWTYSHAVPDAQVEEPLRRWLATVTGRRLDRPSRIDVPLGGEDDPARWLDDRGADGPPSLAVVLFALAATPERETHGAFLRALAAGRPGAAPLLVVVDETGFGPRFGAERLAQRRDAWRRMLREAGHEARFADLDATAAGR